MELELKKKNKKEKQKSFTENFIKEIGTTLEKRNKDITKKEKKQNQKLTDEEELEFEKREFKFLQNFFEEELKDISKGEAYIVTDKYENDIKYNRYKVTQYKNHLEYKFITFKKDLPSNVQIRDIVRKINGKYIYDEKATKDVKNAINKIKQEIINERETNT